MEKILAKLKFYLTRNNFSLDVNLLLLALPVYALRILLYGLRTTSSVNYNFVMACINRSLVYCMTSLVYMRSLWWWYSSDDYLFGRSVVGTLVIVWVDGLTYTVREATALVIEIITVASWSDAWLLWLRIYHFQYSKVLY